MTFTIGYLELLILAAVILAIVRPGILNRILRLVDDYLFAAEPSNGPARSHTGGA